MSELLSVSPQKDTNSVEQGFTLMTSFDIVLSPDTDTEVRASTNQFSSGTVYFIVSLLELFISTQQFLFDSFSLFLLIDWYFLFGEVLLFSLDI